MDMGPFWDSVPQADLISLKKVKSDYPDAYKAAKEGFMEDDDVQVEFAYTVIPNCGPAGPTVEGDEAALDAEDPDGDDCIATGPSVCGEKQLMAYNADADELHTWSAEAGWVLWNY